MKCSICNKEIILVPSAKERAKKYGGKASDYTKLFTSHAQCAIDKRREDTFELMKRLSKWEITRKNLKNAIRE